MAKEGCGNHHFARSDALAAHTFFPKAAAGGGLMLPFERKKSARPVLPEITQTEDEGGAFTAMSTIAHRVHEGIAAVEADAFQDVCWRESKAS